MTIENLKRGKEIESRIRDLDKMQRWLKDTENRAVSLIATGCSVNDTVQFSDDMRTAILGMCIVERAKLEKEFENL